MQLSRDCQKQLEQAEARVEILLKKAGGEMVAAAIRARGRRGDLRPLRPDETPRIFRRRPPAVDAALERLLPPENERPAVIHHAMRYSVFAGGKRVRPILCLEAFAHIFERRQAAVLPVACALEFIHTYSLIHDDLPALDNDDLRRGPAHLPQEIRRGHGHPGGRRAADAGV